MRVPVGISNRHIHLSQKDADILFGKNYQFTIFKELSQPGQYAYQETVTAKGPKGEIPNIKILGPVRNETQLEILYSDNYILGINAPIKLSGDLKDSAGGITLIGPNGTVDLPRGVIVAQRHLHISEQKAEERGLKKGQIIKIRIESPRPIIFENVIVRTSPKFDLDFHIDRDEGNALGQSKDLEGEIIK